MSRLAHRRRLLVAAALAGAIALGACSGDHVRSRTIELSDCRLPKLATAAQCGWLEVPEDRTKPDGRKIRLFAAMLPANTLSPKPDPFVILAGGPGQSATSLATFASRLVEVRRTRDVVLIDQRGTGRSSPLECDAFKPDDATQDALDTDPLPKAKACAAELVAKGVDAAQYTTAAWVADLEAMRTALGYERWNLWGGSYGSRAALEYVRRHPARVRTLVLDGVAPPDFRISLGVWASREQALDALIDACVASDSCRSGHPAIRDALVRIRDDLGPRGREFRVANPRTGTIETVTVTFDAVIAGIHPLTYAPELAAALPEMLDRAVRGDWAPLFAAAQTMTSGLAEQVNVALHYSVTCAEDTPRITEADRRRLDTIRSRSLATKVVAVCDLWPRGTQPADAIEPVRSDTPALLLSGGLDPVTPPSYGEQVAKTLTNSRHIVGAGYGHIISSHACGPRLLAAFVERAAFDKLPESCIEHFTTSKRPPLWRDRLTPAP